LKRVH
jgi:hypothetical protein